MLNMTPGAEYSFDYTGASGENGPRTILFVGLTVNATKGTTYIRGMDMVKKQYRTFNLKNVDLASIKHVRG